MESLRVHGGVPLHGTVKVSGAKNAALPILAATVLHGGKYVLYHCPRISDVTAAGEIITYLGGRVVRVGDTLTVDTRELRGWTIPASLMGTMRASVLFLGALLGRFGRAVLTLPGGCALGRRPIDLHLEALARMGAAVTLHEGEIRCHGSRLHGGIVEFPFPSVGATENFLLAAVSCHGTVRLTHAAKEPEVVDLVRFLQAMGADIQGAGTSVLTVTGGLPLRDTEYTILPDRIETATILCAAAACGGNVTLEGTNPALLLPVLQTLEEAGCMVSRTGQSISLAADGRLTAPPPIETSPYPGFPTDAQAPVMAALLRAKGATRFSETIFECRFGHVPQLRRMGGQIELLGSTALVRGVERLHGGTVTGSDLRAAAALVIAALQTPEETTVTGLKYLDRGYDSLEKKLRSLGADIRRVQ